MEVFLRLATKKFIIQQADPAKAEEALRQPGRFLLFLREPSIEDYLVDTRIELPDEVEYLLDRQAAADLLAAKQTISLIRLYDGQTRSFDRPVVEKSLAGGPLFDQSGC